MMILSEKEKIGNIFKEGLDGRHVLFGSRRFRKYSYLDRKELKQALSPSFSVKSKKVLEERAYKKRAIDER